jgi:hypothetical protein
VKGERPGGLRGMQAPDNMLKGARMVLIQK